jgi:hypothetical protein
MSSRSNVLRVLLVLGGAAASVATSAVDPGERAGSGACPAGETCSDATPTGLYFGGIPTGDRGLWGSQWPRATATGGRQTILLYLDADGEELFDAPFAATLSSDAMSIAGKGRSSVVLRGERAGAASLRIAEPGSDLLYDRISLETATIDRLELTPAGKHLGRDLDLWESYQQELAVWVGGSARVTVAMYAAGGTRVVDELMAVDAAPELAPDPQGNVDTVLVTPAEPGRVEIVARAAGGTGRLSVEAVASAARILGPSPSHPIRLKVDVERDLCFRAEAASGAVLLGAGFVYRTEGTRLGLAQAEDDIVSRCIRVIGREPGDAVLTVTAAGATLDVPIEVVPDGARLVGGAPPVLAPPVLAPIEPTLPGDRAEASSQ